MGLQPVALANWLPRLATPWERARKRGLMALANLPEPVNAALSHTNAVQSLAAELVSQQLRQLGLTHTLDESLAPLPRVAAWLPDDLCLLQRQPQQGEYHLVAASLCSPSYWSLSQNLGQPLQVIHAPVPDLNQQLGRRIGEFFDKLPIDRVFVRRNFFVHQHHDLYQPDPEIDDDPARAWGQSVLRSERQSLRRIDAQSLLFSIRVDMAPLKDISGWPLAAAGLTQAVAQFSQAQQAAFGGLAKCQSLLRWLAPLARSAG